MSEISSKEVYERISNILKTPFQILKNDYETPKKEVNLAVDWDKDIVDKAMKKIIQENPFYSLEYQWEPFGLYITVCCKGNYQLNQGR